MLVYVYVNMFHNLWERNPSEKWMKFDILKFQVLLWKRDVENWMADKSISLGSITGQRKNV